MTDAAPNPLAAASAATEALAARGAAATLGLRSRDGRLAVSALLWRPGLAIAAAEPLAEAGGEEGDLAATLPDGTEAPAAVLGRDPATDVVLLRVPAAEALAPLDATPAPTAPGRLAMAVGRGPHGPTAALGVVSIAGPAWRSRRGGRIAARLELDLRLTSEAEGGPVLDAATGGLLGMGVHGPRRRALVIPAETLDAAATVLLQHGHPRRAWLGAALQPVPLPGGGRGLIVVSVAEGGPSATPDGLRLGDVLTAWDGAPLHAVRDVAGRLADGEAAIGRPVRLTLLRGGAPAEARVTPAERPRPGTERAAA